MDIASPDPPARRRLEPVVPMINIVFLLLIFVLLSARLDPPAAIEIDLPGADGTVSAPPPSGTLLAAADGRLAFAEARDDAVWAAIATWQAGSDAPLVLRADAGLDGAGLAGLLGRLAAAGVRQVHLVTLPRPSETSR